MKMFEKRLRGYRAIGYARDEAPLGLQEVGDETVVEYDEEVLRNLEEQDPSASTVLRVPGHRPAAHRQGDGRAAIVLHAGPHHADELSVPSNFLHSTYSVMQLPR